MHHGIGHMVRGGEWTTPPSPLGPGHNTSPLLGPGHNTSPPPPGTRSQHLPPPPLLGPGRNTSLPPPLLGPGHNTSPPPPGTRSQHLPPPLRSMGRAVRILLECILVEDDNGQSEIPSRPCIHAEEQTF